MSSPSAIDGRHVCDSWPEATAAAVVEHYRLGFYAPLLAELTGVPPHALSALVKRRGGVMRRPGAQLPSIEPLFQDADPVMLAAAVYRRCDSENIGGRQRSPEIVRSAPPVRTRLHELVGLRTERVLAHIQAQPAAQRAAAALRAWVAAPPWLEPARMRMLTEVSTAAAAVEDAPPQEVTALYDWMAHRHGVAGLAEQALSFVTAEATAPAESPEAVRPVWVDRCWRRGALLAAAGRSEQALDLHTELGAWLGQDRDGGEAARAVRRLLQARNHAAAGCRAMAAAQCDRAVADLDRAVVLLAGLRQGPDTAHLDQTTLDMDFWAASVALGAAHAPRRPATARMVWASTLTDIGRRPQRDNRVRELICTATRWLGLPATPDVLSEPVFARIRRLPLPRIPHRMSSAALRQCGLPLHAASSPIDATVDAGTDRPALPLLAALH